MKRVAAITMLVVALGGGPGQAQTGGVPFTLDPAMSKGPSSAPVTVVEFSDYQ